MLGSVHQFRCHRILRRLRAAAPAAGARAYGIPRGDGFERVSCAHYLVRRCDCVPARRILLTVRRLPQAEIVIYLGLVLMCAGATTPVRFCSKARHHDELALTIPGTALLCTGAAARRGDRKPTLCCSPDARVVPG